MTRSGIGRQQFNNHRLALANKIAQKHSQLTETTALQQYLPVGTGELKRENPRNLTEAEAQHLGTLRDHRQHDARRGGSVASRSAPPSYRTRETASVAPTYESFTPANPFYKFESDYQPSTVAPSYKSNDPEE